MSLDIALQTTNYQVGDLTWKLSRIGDEYHNNVTLDTTKFPTKEIQTVTITGTPTGGTFTLTFNGQTTGTIAFNAAAATVVSALEALSNVDVGDVVGAGGALPGTAVTITFQGQYLNTNVPQMTANGALLTGGTTPTVTVTTTQNAGFGDGFIPSGTALGKVTATGLYGPYEAGASDGREVFTGLLIADVTVRRSNGTLAAKVASGQMVRGDVKQSKLPVQTGIGSVDAAAKVDNPLIRFE